MGLFFKTCVVCGEIAKDELCSDCKALLVEEQYIHRFSVKLNEKHFNVCSLFLYSGIMECVIKAYKLNMHERLVYVLSGFLKKFIEDENIDKEKTLFIPLPSSKKGFRERGFNQVEMILKKSDLNYYSLLSLNKKHKQKVQKTLNKKDRFYNSLNKFIINKNCDLSYIRKFENVVVIDDIWTTGASITNAIKVVDDFFKIQGKKTNISGLVLAKGGGYLNF